ncbi:MAG TPA: hypothetical protein VGK52_10675 [Polyangia bacterium]
MKALAARARAETGGPVLRQNPAELSGVRPRRDSVIGMRLTPPPRATSGELPNWFWGVLGCLSVLLLGFAGLFVLGRSGRLAPLLGQAATLVAPAAGPAAPAAAPVAPAEPLAGAAAPAPVAGEPAVKEPERPAPAAHAAEVERAGQVEHAEPTEHVAHAAAPRHVVPDEPAPADDDDAPTTAVETGAAKHASRAGKGRPAKADEPAVGGDDNGTSEAAEAKAPPAPAAASPPRPVRAPAAKVAATEGADDDESLPGQDDVERALDALAPKVRGCFVKYQIKGTARVRLVATAAGKAESVNVTGDFEDTPTGLCVESILTDAKLPAFKGPSLKLSQSYQLR